MDLCCLIDSDERLAATDLVTMLGDLLERGAYLPACINVSCLTVLSETKFHVKPLPHARIPIVKLSLDPSPGLPLGIACDIGFENRLALENTRLLMCYAMIDPTRVRTMVLFRKSIHRRLILKHSVLKCLRVSQLKCGVNAGQSEFVHGPETLPHLVNRKINSPYQGTLSSYGYVLLVIYFLVHVKNPAVLPNLQQMPPLRPISQVRYLRSEFLIQADRARRRILI
jgi:terminal uridylyltransferase